MICRHNQESIFERILILVKHAERPYCILKQIADENLLIIQKHME